MWWRVLGVVPRVKSLSDKERMDSASTNSFTMGNFTSHWRSDGVSKRNKNNGLVPMKNDKIKSIKSVYALVSRHNQRTEVNCVDSTYASELIMERACSLELELEVTATASRSSWTWTKKLWMSLRGCEINDERSSNYHETKDKMHERERMDGWCGAEWTPSGKLYVPTCGKQSPPSPMHVYE